MKHVREQEPSSSASAASMTLKTYCQLQGKYLLVPFTLERFENGFYEHSCSFKGFARRVSFDISIGSLYFIADKKQLIEKYSLLVELGLVGLPLELINLVTVLLARSLCFCEDCDCQLDTRAENLFHHCVVCQDLPRVLCDDCVKWCHECRRSRCTYHEFVDFESCQCDTYAVCGRCIPSSEAFHGDCRRCCRSVLWCHSCAFGQRTCCDCLVHQMLVSDGDSSDTE